MSLTRLCGAENVDLGDVNEAIDRLRRDQVEHGADGAALLRRLELVRDKICEAHALLGGCGKALETFVRWVNGYDTREAFVSDLQTLPPLTPPVLSLEELERRAIEQALLATGGRVSRAARLLGIGRATLYRKLAARAAPTPAVPTLPQET
jgi:transcriptional regulator of acetoin/glycerol metabolism